MLYLIATGILRGYSHVHHAGLIPMTLLLVLAVGRGADALSLDRLVRAGRGLPVPPPGEARASYAWTRYACLLVIGMSYASAAFSKLRNGGVDWFTPVNVERIFYHSALNPMEFHSDLPLRFIDAPPVFFAGFGVATLLFEGLGGALILSRLAQRWFPWLATSFHAGVLLFMNIFFWDLVVLPLFFVDFRPAAARFEVFYDGQSARSRRTVRRLGVVDARRQLVFVDVRDAGADTAGVDAAAVAGALHIRAGAELLAGSAAWRVLTRRLPLLWPVWPAWRLLGRRGAVRRPRDVVSEPPGAPLWATPPAETRRPQRIAAGMLAALMLIGGASLEFYPITGWQMFSGIERTGVIEYWQVTATDEAGTTAEVDLADWIPALQDARYRDLFDRFVPARLDLIDELLAAALRAGNRDRAPGHRLVSIEVQRRRWDFRNAPHDPAYGAPILRHVYPAAEPAGAAEARP